jgi:hypothetical protein
VGQLHYGPSRVPSRESPEKAIAILQERGYTACEIDFAAGGKSPAQIGLSQSQMFWMDYPWAERFGELARDAGIVLSIHAPMNAIPRNVETLSIKG